MSEQQWRFANLEIAPAGDLAQTAKILSAAFGEQFRFDTSGNYEEFPAFVATRDNLEYALLGVPDPKYDVRDEAERTTDYQLIVHPIRSNDPGVRIDISDEVIREIALDGRLRCWRME